MTTNKKQLYNSNITQAIEGYQARAKQAQRRSRVENTGNRNPYPPRYNAIASGT